MEDLSEYYKIAQWIAQEIAGTIGVEEQASLKKWLDEDELHQEIYRRIYRRIENEEIARSTNIRMVLEDWKKVKAQLVKKKKWIIWSKSFYRYAAITVLLMTIGIGYWQMRQMHEVSQLPVAMQQEIIAGKAKAILTLAGGEKVVLENVPTDSLRENGLLIRKRDGELLYEETTEKTNGEQELFNTITIPRGGEYKLVLSDGTRVWINSASVLRYPVKFVKGSRKVFLEGEAYFEVSADTIHPFVVQTANLGVNVLGTGFNVMAYPNEELAEVTLVHGRVGVQAGGREALLHPEEQYVYQVADKRGKIRQVNVEPYISWINGILSFDAMPLGDLTAKLSRWYDIDFFFTSNGLKDLKFSGAFKKYNDIQYVLNLIEETTDVRFELKNRTVTVNKK